MKKQFYLKANSLGSVLCFNKVVEHRGANVLLDDGGHVSFRKGIYFKIIPYWDTVIYTRFETREDCIKFIKENFEELKEFNYERDLEKVLNQKSLREE